VRLISNVRATPSSRRIRIALDGEHFDYQPGQAAWLRAEDRAEPTPYSIASSPGETARHGWLEFLVKVDGSTRFGARAAGLRRGTPIAVSGPAGSFVFPVVTKHRNFLFVGGGTGIAPLRSMIFHALDQRLPGRIALLYSARVADEFAYIREFRALAREGRLDLALTLTGTASHWRHGRGRANAEQLAPLLGDAPPLCFICGPSAMVAEIPAALESLGVPRVNVRTEGW
jgi:ferredoxin-NADP reductase